jgi:proline dehydrogenase
VVREAHFRSHHQTGSVRTPESVRIIAECFAQIAKMSAFRHITSKSVPKLSRPATGNRYLSEIRKINFNDAQTSFRSKSFLELLRAYAVFKVCSTRSIVSRAEDLTKLSYRVLGETLTDFVMRRTFFGHFCAGEHTVDMGPTINRLKSAGIGPILDYAAEADIDESTVPPLTTEEKQIVSRVYDYRDEQLCDKREKVFENCIRSAYELRGGEGKDAFAAVKITALGNPLLLERVSITITEIRNLFFKFDLDGNGRVTKEEFKRQYEKYFVGGPGYEKMFHKMDLDSDGSIDYVEWSNALTIEDLHHMTSLCRSEGPLLKATLTAEERELLLDMRARVDRLAELASELNVKIMIDAEHSYFQPAIDNIANILMRKYNRDRTIIFSTYQMYLQDSHTRLLDDMARAKAGGYRFACKLVRGAYMELERARAKEKGYASPVHLSKQDTHDNYNRGVAYMVEKIGAGEPLSLMIASHNQQSIELALEKAAQCGLTPEARIYFGQLLGMADHLTYSLGNAGYRAYKYVPYGKVKEVMPYLIRRAQENSDMLGGVGAELRMLQGELTRRLKLK